MMLFNIFQNIDLLLVGIAIAAIGIIGFVIFLNNPKSITARSFLLFSIITVFWSIFNYTYYKVSGIETAFWFLRLVIFFAVWHAFSFFQLSYVFPKINSVFPKRYFTALLPLIAITSILTLTPFVFSHVTGVSDGKITQIENGPGIILFTFIVLSLIIGGFLLLIQKTRRASAAERKPFLMMLVGITITFILLLAFNFILPAFFNQSQFIQFAPIFLLPFALFTFYAIIRHGLLNMKIIATDILVFFLVISVLFEVLFAQNISEVIFRTFIFVLLLGVGILLIRSVRGEVEQREKLQTLSEELKIANAELKKLDEQKSDFISIASHQLRTPLSVIKGYISLILEGSYGDLPHKVVDPLKHVYTSNDRLVNLVNDLLDLSRIERGKLTYVMQQGSLITVAEDSVKELQEAAKQKNLTLKLEKPKTPVPNVFFDPKKIKEVFINIIDNALHYTLKGSIHVHVLYNPNKKIFRVSVQDTGIGLAPEEIGELFKKFSRADSARRLTSEGTGLGLYVAKLIIEDHKGKIWAESDGHNKGSKFIFELPVIQNV